jgi:hypothetical protein
MANTTTLINKTGMYIDQVSETNPVIRVSVRNNQITEVDPKIVIRTETRTSEGDTDIGDVDGGEF